MQALGLKDMNGAPEEGVGLRPVLHNAPNSEKKKYLRRVASAVVDRYVLRRKKVDLLINKLLAAEREEVSKARTQTPDGRYICQYEGCGKRFAHNGTRLRDHESTHNLQECSEPTPSDKELSTGKSDQSSEKDDMFNYQCALLEYGMLILNFFDAIREGDGQRVFRCWKFQLPYRGVAPNMPWKLLECSFKCMGCFLLSMLTNLYGTDLH